MNQVKCSSSSLDDANNTTNEINPARKKKA
jgi:hypothetical protein